MKKVFKLILNIPKYIAIFFILVYKFCISPFIPHACKFNPSCSIYSSGSFAEWGFFIGLKLTLKRLIKCNHHSIGGTDIVPINPKKKYKNFM
ncbi:MAG: membrane protein insertion efficiency factor YidD [Clostridia bacterium]|nr:membrane protein insertion efficiency factor YidD [Clostridia bacterium]